MSISDSSIKGKFDEIAGKVKQGVGEAVGNDSMANRGTAEQVKGHAEQAWGSVKEAAHDSAANANANYNRGNTAEGSAHDVRESVSSTAANVKDSIRDAVKR